MNFFKDHSMILHIRKFDKNFIKVCFLRGKQIINLKFQLNSAENPTQPIKNYTQNILFCIHNRFRFIKHKNDKVPMQNLSTSPKKTDLNYEKKRLEKSRSLQPKEATLKKILQFASSYRVERIAENQYVEWYLN
jgi:hypothetical protein